MFWLIGEAVGLFIVVLILLYYYSISALQFWKKQGVKGPKPIPFLGNFKDVYLGRCSMNDVFVKAYNEFKDESMVGIFNGHIPYLILKDPNLIKEVLIKNFPNFVNRLFRPNKVELVSQSLLLLEGQTWKFLRGNITGIFSSGKLKEMFPMMLECGNRFEQCLDKLVQTDGYIACHEMCGKYTSDTVSLCVFGVEMKLLATKDNEFHNVTRAIIDTSMKSVYKDKLREYPFLFNIFGRFMLDHEIDNFFMRFTKDSIDYRIQHDFHRNDLIEALVKLKKNPGNNNDKMMMDKYLAAQSLFLYQAGYETTALAVTNTLYELALNQTVQDKLRAEIKDVLQQNNGKLTYEIVNGMKYLNAVLQEALRKYPVVLWISRRAMESYTFPGTQITISKNQHVVVPVDAIHNDPNIFPNPQAFDPNRFLGEDAKSRHPMFYLPFGDGPRNCICSKFAKMQAKVGLVKVFANFKVDVCEKTVKYRRNPKQLMILQPLQEIYLKITKA